MDVGLCRDHNHNAHFAIEIRCRDPEKNGVLSTQVLTHSVGGVAHYSCPRGFYMEGNETRICLQNGSWSGTTPACFCKDLLLHQRYYFPFLTLKVLPISLQEVSLLFRTNCTYIKSQFPWWYHDIYRL